jgi:hypothetical protein
MEKKKLTFVPDGNNTYAGFDGTEIVALVVPYYPFGETVAPAWQWCARSKYGQHERIGWTFPDRDGWCVQRERDLEDAIRRAVQHIGHGYCRPVYLCDDTCSDCPSIVILPPEEVDK